jgi:hypothetical protein
LNHPPILDQIRIGFNTTNTGITPFFHAHLNIQSGKHSSVVPITHVELKGWSFYGIVKPNPFRQSKFYRWMIIIMGKEPEEEFSVYNLIGKQRQIYLQKKNKGDKIYYSVKELLPAS